jgi:hypothetical protein
MSQGQPEPTLSEQVALHYMSLLNEVNGLGLERFAAMVDAATDQEKTQLLQACNVVRSQIAKFVTKVG